MNQAVTIRRPPGLTQSMVCLRRLRAAWAIPASFAVTACVPASLPIYGEVTEAGTGRPIGDVTVTVVWEGRGWESSYCAHVQSGNTGDTGRYHIPFQADVFTSKDFDVEVARHYTYKRGYRDIRWVGFVRGFGKDYIIYSAPDPSLTSATLVSLGLDKGKPVPVEAIPQNENTVQYIQKPLPAWWRDGKHDLLLVPDTSAPAARLEYLSKLVWGTKCYGAGERNLVPFYERMAEEAMEIAVTESDKKIAASICQAVGNAATAADRNSGSADYEKRSIQYLRERYPTCWKTVLDASRKTQRMVYGGCDHDRRNCSGGVIIKTCDLEGCVETRGTPTQNELDWVWSRSGVNSKTSPRVEPAGRPLEPAENSTARPRPESR